MKKRTQLHSLCFESPLHFMSTHPSYSTVASSPESSRVSSALSQIPLCVCNSNHSLPPPRLSLFLGFHGTSAALTVPPADRFCPIKFFGFPRCTSVSCDSFIFLLWFCELASWSLWVVFEWCWFFWFYWRRPATFPSCLWCSGGERSFRCTRWPCRGSCCFCEWLCRQFVLWCFWKNYNVTSLLCFPCLRYFSIWMSPEAFQI